jgi:hypothetical protein
MATADIQRKTGDTLVVKGVLDGTNLPLAPAWAGALAKINIATVAGALIRDHAVVTLDTNTLAFEYRGAALPEGVYYYEIEVMFTDGTILTFPNDSSARLSVAKAVA